MTNFTYQHNKHVVRLRDRLRAAYPNEIEVRETTPALGGVRERDVALLVKEGSVEWTEPGLRARAVAPKT